MEKASRSAEGVKDRWDWISRAAASETDECLDWPWYCFSRGYGAIRRDGKLVGVHTIVCEIVHGPRPAGMWAAHSCGRRVCCSGAHLRWATPKENYADRLIHGTDQRGDRHPTAKLTEDSVRAIRSRVAEGGVTYPELAAEYGVSPGTIGEVVRRRRWGWVA